MTDVIMRSAPRLIPPDGCTGIALGMEQKNLAVAQRLVNDPRFGITRVTVVGVNGTHVIVPAPAPHAAPATAREERGLNRILRLHPRK